MTLRFSITLDSKPAILDIGLVVNQASENECFVTFSLFFSSHIHTIRLYHIENLYYSIVISVLYIEVLQWCILCN